jgi:PE-PPE domain
MATKVKVHARTITAAAAMATAVMIAFNPTAAAADTALIIGATGVPTPPQNYVDAADNLYLVPNGYGSYTPQVVTTPEQAYPLTGANGLTAVTSVAQGATSVDGAINEQIAAGNRVVVFGYSQGAAVVTQSMAQLTASSTPPSPSQLSFVLIGDPQNPNGGLGTRFNGPGTSLPLLGEAFNNAPTASNTYPTAVYTQEYDGFANFPQYPLNVVSDLNAIVGIFTQHFGYLDLTPQQISSAIPRPTTGGTTQYYMIPNPNLPLLDPVRLIPLIGNPLADLLQPDLTVIVNLGYGSITNGWSPGPANVPTPFGLIPTNINPSDLVTALANGIPQGITNALNDLKSPQLFDFSSLSLLLSGLNTVGLTASATPSLPQLLAGLAAIGNAGVPVTSTSSSVLANDLALGKPLADTPTALAVTLPQYDAQLFVKQLQAGNLLNAVGMPIAADLALVPYTLLVGGLFPIVGAAAGTLTQLAEITGLEPNPVAAPTTKVGSTATTNAQPARSTSTGANAANARNSVQSVVNTAVSSVTTPVRTALTGGSKPVTTAVSKPTTPAAGTSAPTVKPAAGQGKKH